MNRKLILGIAAGVILLAGVIAWLVLGNKSYTGYETVQELENGEALEYAEIDGVLVRCGKEGAQAIAKDGTLLWNVTYGTMKNPKYVFCGSVMAVADIGEKQYLLSDGSGTVKTFSTPYPIQMLPSGGRFRRNK